MEQFQNHKYDYPKMFVKAGLFFMLSTLLFGLFGAIEYAFPGVFRDLFSFTKIRPLHVSSAVFWIVLGAVGSVLFFLREHNSTELKSWKALSVQFYLLVGTFVIILLSYFFDIFGGREYWSFHPAFSVPVAIGWIIFIVVFISNMKTLKGQPVFIWMWSTGILFFLFTYLESKSWVIPSLRNNIIKDMTIQWKSYGSLVGAWNMLIYGSSIYLMDKISGNWKYSNSGIAFWLYFLGLFNLMFNWGHHIYLLPVDEYIKHIGYVVSMTELILFARIIYLWKSSLETAKKNINIIPYRFLLSADIWVFITLGLAIIMSIPSFNVFMHGTHVIVSHTMGATIGINTMLLLAFASYILGVKKEDEKMVKRGNLIANIALGVFWLTLLIAGFVKAYWEFTYVDYNYTIMLNSLKHWFHIFLLSGCFLITGLVMVAIPLLKNKEAKSTK